MNMNMLRMTTNRKGWLDNNGSDTSRSLMSGLSLSPQANFTIASKLKEKLRKAREALATKKSNPESLQTEQTQIERTIIKEKSVGDSDDENLRIPLDIHRAEGFTEKYDEQNELQRKARQTAAMLKKTIKKREPAVKNANSVNPQTIPILNYQYQAGSGQVMPPTNLRHMTIFESNPQGTKFIQEEKYNMKIDDPNSVLHIANYHQNKDFEHYAKVIVEDNKQYLKINAPDAFTFFRIHHELHEINRKKTCFLDLKNKFFDNKDPEEVIQYDENLDNFDMINSDKNYSTTGKKKETTDKKEHQYAEKVAKRLKETGKKKDLKSLEKNFAYGLMEGIKESRMKQDLY